MSEQLIADPPLSTSPPLPTVPAVTTPPIPYIYIGPNSSTLGVYSLSIYPELPATVQAAMVDNPALNVLFPTLDQWRSIKSGIISNKGNMTYTGSVKHAVDFLKSKGVL